MYESQFSELSCTEAAIRANPTCSKKRKRSPERNSKLDDALDKLIGMNKDASAFEAFGETVGKQIKEFPEEEAYEIMADIQVMLSKKKLEILRKYRTTNLKIVSVQTLKPLENFQPIAPLPQNSNSSDSSDVEMFDTDILEEEFI